MEITSAALENLKSVQSAISTVMLSKAMNQDGQSLDTLLQGLQETSAKTMEQAVNPHLGGHIDLRV